MAFIAAPQYAKLHTLADKTTYGYINIRAEAGRPTLLFLHGYPSSSYHWYNQIEQCVGAGYGMIAPDLLGYGDSSKPVDISAYDNTILSRHVVEILDHENVSQVVGIGHDWGAILLSTMIRAYPDRFLLLVFLATGYLASQAVLMDVEAYDRRSIQSIGRPLLGYWLFHNKVEAASIIESQLESFETLLYADAQTWIDHVCPTGALEKWLAAKHIARVGSWVKQSDMETHINIMNTGGFTGPLNWYKQAMSGITHFSEAKTNPKYASTKFQIPVLFIGCEKDAVSIPNLQSARMGLYFRDLTIKSLDSGHWVMLERPNEMWKMLQAWIERKARAAKL